MKFKISKNTNRKLNAAIQGMVVDYDSYEHGNIRAIIGRDRHDTEISRIMTYGEWVAKFEQFRTVKVEGLESNNQISKIFRHPRDIHLFVQQRNSYSFPWHTDDVDVYLHVVSGVKRVQLPTGTFTLTANTGIWIPRGVKHRVYSKKKTMALSLGF